MGLPGYLGGPRIGYTKVSPNPPGIIKKGLLNWDLKSGVGGIGNNSLLGSVYPFGLGGWIISDLRKAAFLNIPSGPTEYKLCDFWVHNSPEGVNPC